jgi:hypothetical protein
MGGLIEIFGHRLNTMDALLAVWFVFVAVSVGYVTWDNFARDNPEETVMKWGWLLITLYMGPIALALYILTGKSPRPGSTPSSSNPCGNRVSARRCTASLGTHRCDHGGAWPSDVA